MRNRVNQRPSLPRRGFLRVLAGVPVGLSLAAVSGNCLQAEETKHRADWMRLGSYGVMVHWLAPGPAREKGEYIHDLNRAVDGFDLDRFVQDFQATGADWLIFTIGQNTSYYASPNARSTGWLVQGTARNAIWCWKSPNVFTKPASGSSPTSRAR